MTTTSAAADIDVRALKLRVVELERELRGVHVQLRQARRGRLLVGDLEIDQFARIVRRRGEALALRPREYHLLAVLARHQGDLVTGREVSRELYGRATPGRRATVATHLSRLRIALAGTEVSIITERGSGYRLRVDSACLSGRAATALCMGLAPPKAQRAISTS